MMFAPAADAQGGRLAFSLDDEIWTMRADGSERTRLTDTPGEATSGNPAWSPDGKQIAFVRGDEADSIWVRDFGSGGERARKLGNFRRVAHALHISGVRARRIADGGA
jgi:Tol biopolymer transport system component